MLHNETNKGIAGLLTPVLIVKRMPCSHPPQRVKSKTRCPTPTKGMYAYYRTRGGTLWMEVAVPYRVYFFHHSQTS